MKTLSVLGTAAMFLVGGGILVHGIPLLHHWCLELHPILGNLVAAATGIVLGTAALAVFLGVRSVIARLRSKA